MKRLAPVLLALGLAFPAAAAAAPATATKLSGCRSSLQLLQRKFDLAAHMRAIRGTKQMGIRFDLFEHRPGQPGYTALRAPSFGVWLQSGKGTAPYNYIRRINGLDAPATYHVRVGYRWYGKHGRVLRTSHTITRACRQYDLRPDLRIRFVTVQHGKKGHDRYVVSINNAGVTAAHPFVLRLFFPGGDVKLWDIPGLAAGASTRRVLTGAPACSGGAPTATVDSGATVDETNEQNNTLVAVCPAS
jgi:CARDB